MNLPRVAPNTVVYAIGDIHGAYDHLLPVLQAIRRDAAQAPRQRRVAVFMGDYINWGNTLKLKGDTRRALNILSVLDPAAWNLDEAHFLRGNHEQLFIRLLDGDLTPYRPEQDVVDFILRRRKTMRDYGLELKITPDTAFLNGARVPHNQYMANAIARGFLEKIPPHHSRFIRNTCLSYTSGDYHFSHAGIDQHKTKAQQSTEDLVHSQVFPCAPFHSSWKYTAFVVGDHAVPEIENFDRYMCIDTIHEGRLTCMRLEGDTRGFLTSAAWQSETARHGVQARPAFCPQPLITTARQFIPA